MALIFIAFMSDNPYSLISINDVKPQRGWGVGVGEAGHRRGIYVRSLPVVGAF